MNEAAIHDLLGTVLSGWYRSVAEWSPPGLLSGQHCQTCPSSLVARVIDVTPWPHDLVHQLAASLDIVVDQIAESVEEDAYAEGAPRHLRVAPEGSRLPHVRRLVLATIAENSADMLDVIRECVEPRLEAYLRSETERGLRELTR